MTGCSRSFFSKYLIVKIVDIGSRRLKEPVVITLRSTLSSFIVR